MTSTVSNAARDSLPAWVASALARSLRQRFPGVEDDAIDAALKRAAASMQPAYCLATLLSQASKILRERSKD
jgi:hypothetical protein